MAARADLEVVLKATDRASPSIKNLQSTIIRFVGAVSAALAGLSAIAFPIKQAAEFEKELKNVQKTTGFVTADIEVLGDALSELSKELVTPAVELAKIAAVAGQLGLGREGAQGVVEFTRTIAIASQALDLAAEQAATTGARLQNIFQLPLNQVTNVFSTINELSNTTTANAESLIDVIQRLGNTAGLAFQETAALAATAIDVGVSREVAGTSLGKVFQKLQTDTKDIAEALGLNIGEFIGLGAFERFQLFIKTLSTQSEALRAENIRNLIGSGRLFVTVDKLVNDAADGGGKLSEAMKTANLSFLAGTSILTEYNIQTDALIPQLGILGNNFIALSREVGDVLIPRLTELTRDLTAFLQTDTARRFAENVGAAFSTAVEFVVDMVKAIAELDVNWINVLATIKLFVGIQLAQVLIGITRATGLWIAKLVLVDSGLLKIVKSLRAMAVASAASTAAAGVSVTSLGGVIRTVGTLLLRLAGPVGLIVGVGAVIFGVLKASGLEITSLFNRVAEFFGFVSSQQAEIAAQQSKQIADLRDKVQKAGADIRAVQQQIDEGAFQQDISVGIELDRDSGLGEFDREVAKGIKGLSELQKGVRAVGIESDAVANRQVSITQEIRDQEKLYVENQSLISQTGNLLVDGTNILSIGNTFVESRLVSLRKEGELIRARQGRLRQEFDDNILRQAELTSAADEFQTKLTTNARAIGETFSRQQIRILQLAVAARQAGLEVNETTEQLANARANLSNLNDRDATSEGEAEADAIRRRILLLEETRKKGIESVDKFKDQLSIASEEISDNALAILTPTIAGINNLTGEPLADTATGLLEAGNFAREAGSAMDDLSETTNKFATDLAALRIEKSALEEIGKAAKDLAATAKGAFDNTSRTIRAFRSDVLEAVRELTTGLGDRRIDLRVRVRQAELDSQLTTIEESRKDIIAQFDEDIANASRETERTSLRRRKDEALEALKTEQAAVESTRAFLEEKALNDRIKRLQDRAADFVAAAKNAARAGNVDEALGLSEAARSATKDIGGIIDELAKLEEIDPFGNTSFRVTEKEIRELLGEFKATERSVTQSIPQINRDLKDATQGAADQIIKRESAIDQQIANLTKQIVEMNQRFPGIQQVIESLADRRTQTILADAQRQGRALGSTPVLSGTDLSAVAARAKALQDTVAAAKSLSDAADESLSATELERKLVAELQNQDVERLRAVAARGDGGAAFPPDLGTQAKPMVVEFDSGTTTIFKKIDQFLRGIARRFAPPPSTDSVTVGARGATGGTVVAKAAGGDIKGPGTGTSDSIMAMLSNGEFVINNQTRRFFGSSFFHGLQAYARKGGKARLPGFAAGGLASGLGASFEPVVQAAGLGGAPVHIHLPGGDTMRLREGDDTVTAIKRTMNREARKRGGRVR